MEKNQYFIEKFNRENASSPVENSESSSLSEEAKPSPLHEAIKKGSLEEIKACITANNINTENAYGNSPLNFALKQKKDIEVIKLLVNNGADVNYTDEESDTPLSSAVESGNIEVIKFLLNENANVNSADAHGEYDKLTYRPIHFATLEKNATEILKLLVKYGADITTPNEEGDSLLHVALDNDAPIDTIEYLVKELELDVNVCNEHSNSSVLQTLYQENNSENNDQIEITKLLLDKGIKVNHQDSNGNTILHTLATRDTINTIELLLEKNANPDIINNQGDTALHRAATEFNKSEILELLATKESINALNSRNKTPLHKAALKLHGSNITTLLNKGADASITNEDGMTALDSILLKARKSNFDHNEDITEAINRLTLCKNSSVLFSDFVASWSADLLEKAKDSDTSFQESFEPHTQKNIGSKRGRGNFDEEYSDKSEANEEPAFKTAKYVYNSFSYSDNPSASPFSSPFGSSSNLTTGLTGEVDSDNQDSMDI